MVVLVMGLPGSGKSYFAVRLAQRIDAVYVSSDLVRKEFFSAIHYSKEGKTAVYKEMLHLTKDLIEKGRSVVLDATFYTDAVRKLFANALGHTIELYMIEIVAPETLIKRRLKLKRENSEANFDIHLQVKDQWEAIAGDYLQLRSANDNIEEMLEVAMEYCKIRIDDGNGDR